MNKTYRVVWNESTNTWVAVAEIATARGKSGKAKVVATGVAVMGALASSAAQAGLVWGDNASAPYYDSISMGNGSKAKTNYTITLGTNAENTSNGEAGVIIGNGSKAITDVNPNTAKNTMGQQVVVGEASEANSQSVAIGAQVYAKGQSSIAIGGDDLGNNDSKTSAGKYSGANDWRNYAGQPITVEGVTTKDASNPAIGFTSTTASGRGSIAIGHMSQSTGKASLAFGADSHAEADGAIAAGMVAKATNSAAIALGVGANASEAHATAIGLKAQAAKTDAVALGTNAVANKDNAVALGSGAETGTDAGQITKATVNGVEYSGFAGQAPAAGYQVSVGAKNAERQIKHVAAGAITDDSTDAINGSQLYSIANGLQTRINNGFNVTATANGGTVTGTAVDKIGNGETLKFEAGNGITINQSDNTLKISAAQAAQQVIQAAPVPVTNSTSNTPLLVNTQNGTTTISANTTPLKKNANTGGVSVETGHENKLMTAGQVAQAFTDSGFQLSTGTNGGGTKDAGSTGTEVIHPGDQVTINAGKNLAVLQQASGKVTLRLTDDISLNSVTTVDNAGNQTVTNGGGITITPAGGSAVSLTKDGLNNGGKKITNVAPGTDPTDAVNVSQLNAAKTVVKADPNSPVSVTGDGSAAKPYTVGVNTTPLSHTTNGAVNTPSTPDAGKLVTAGEIAKAINNAGFTVTSGKTGAGQVTGTSETVVKPGNTVKFVAGDGIKIDQNAGEFTISNTNTGGNSSFKVAGNGKAAGVTADDETIKAGETLSIKGTGTGAFTDYDGSNIQTQLGQNGEVTIGLKKDLAVNSVTTADTAGNKTVTGPNGITITPAAPGSTPVSLTNNGLNNGGNTIKGVGSALNTYTSGKPQGLVDLSALTPDQKASAATAGDLANMGWVLSSDKTTGNLGTAFNTQVKNANEVEFVGKNGATVSAQTDVSGKHVVTVDVNAQSIGNNIQQPVVYTQADGSKVYKQPDGTFNTAADGSGTVVQPADIIASMQGADGATTATPATKDADGIMTMAGGTTLNNVASAGDITNPANAYRAVNAGDLNNSVQNLVNNGFKIDADSGTVDTVKLGETVKYAGDSNIVTKVSNNRIDFALANIVTVGDAATGKPVKIDGTAGTVTGLTNITWDPATTPITSGRAATEDQLLAVANAANSAGAGFTIAGNSKAAGVTTADETIKAGETLSIKGTGTGTFADYDSSNIQTQVGANGEVTVGLKKDLNVNSVTAGNTKVDNGGITITNPADPSKNVSLTGNGLNNGGNKITNVGDGVADTDAVNVRQLKAAQTNVNNLTNNVIGTNRPNLTTYDVYGNVADNQNTVVDAINKMNTGGIKFFHVNDGTGTQSTAGTLSHPEDSSAKGNYGAAVGYQAKADGENSLAFGKGAQATGTNAISIGSGNVVTGNNSGAIGDPTTITGSGTYTIGNNNGVVSANNAGAFGNNNTLTGDNSRIIGNSSTVTTTDTFVMGNHSTSNVANSVVLGSNAAATSAATASSAGTTTYASSVINGTTYNYAGATPTGVVSVGDVGKERRVQNVAAGLISADSTDAINGSQLYATNSAINALQTGAAGIVQYSNGDARPNGGSPTNHVTMVGADRNAPVTVHNVAPGVAPTDAVNVSQLQGVAGQINKVADEADAGTAAAMAAAGLPQAYLPGKSMVAVSGSTYRGKQGYAVGFSAINDGGNWIVKGIATGNSKGKFGATIGAGYQW